MADVADQTNDVCQGQQEQNTEQEEEYIADPILLTEEMKKMFVGGLTLDTKEEDLKEFMERISGGSVIEVVIIKKDNDKKSAFGFVTFETSELIDEVLLKRKELNFNNRMLDVNRAVPKNNLTPGARDRTKKLFVANLPRTGCTEDDLEKYFKCRHKKQYGEIESVQLIKKKDEKGNKTSENRGIGFVLVSNEDMADKMAIQHATFEFGGRKIELKKSVPTTEGGGGQRGGGRGRGRGGQQQSYGGGGGYDMYGGGYESYGGGGYYQGGGGYGGGGYDYSGGYGGQYAGGYGGGYGSPAPRGRGGRGRARYNPY